jgi:hypothetical protein
MFLDICIMFKLKDLSDLKRENDVVKSYYDVYLPERAIDEDNFATQPLRFVFSNSQNQWWVPSKSFMRCSIKITEDGASPNLGRIAPSFNFTSCLFRDCSLSVDNLTIERVSNKFQEIDSLKKRMKHRGHINSVEDRMNFMMTSFAERTNAISIDGVFPTDHTLRVATHDILEDEDGVNVFDTVYKPPLSLFNECKEALPSGEEWALTLNPNLDYQTACIQALTQAIDGVLVDVKVVVSNVRLYVYKVERETPTPMTKDFFLDCLKVQCHERNIDGEQYEDDFTVAPNTKWLGLALQHVNSGSSRVHPSTQFIEQISNNNDARERKLTNLRFTYAMQNAPNPDERLELTDEITNLAYAYYNNLVQTDRHDKDVETYEEWLRNGPYHLYKFDKDRLDESQNVHLYTQYSVDMTGMRLLLFSIHSETTYLKMVNGKYVKVESRTV